MAAVKHSSNCMPPLTTEMLLNATVDVSDNVTLEDGYCPLQFRTHGYVTCVQLTDHKLTLQLIGLLTERSITATLLFDEVTLRSAYEWVRRGHHVQIMGILKRTPTKLNAHLSLTNPVTSAASPVTASVDRPEDVVRFISIYTMQRVKSPLDGDVFLKEALVCVKRRNAGLGPTLAQVPRSTRARDRNHTHVRFMTQRVCLTDDAHMRERMFLPVSVEDADASLQCFTAITPFATPIDATRPYFTIPIVDLRKSTTSVAADEPSKGNEGNEGSKTSAPFPKERDVCVVLGAMENMQTFRADLCVSYPPTAPGQAVDLVVVAKLRNSDLHPHLPKSEALLLC